MRRFGFALAFRPGSVRLGADQGADCFARHGLVPADDVIEITGQPIKEIVFTPGGVPAKMDPNGKYQVEQMYVQYFLLQNRKGKLPLLVWHGAGSPV